MAENFEKKAKGSRGYFPNFDAATTVSSEFEKVKMKVNAALSLLLRLKFNVICNECRSVGIVKADIK